MCFIKIISLTITLLIAAIFGRPVMAAENPNWAQQLVGPVQGTDVHHNETSDFGRYNFVSGPEAGGAIAKAVSIEGKKSEIIYKAPGKTPFEIYSVYKKFFTDKGYETLFACEGKACGQNFRGVWYNLNPFENNPGWDNSTPLTNGSWESQFYIAARKKSAAGDTYAAVFTNAGWWNYPGYRVDVSLPAPLGSGVVPASRIAEALNADGRMAFYGITFDTGSSVIKTESEPALAEIASFLKKAAGEVFYVVGHTDGQGTLTANMDLAQARAVAVKETLIGKYGVPAGMLSAHGGGPLSPLATNSTEAGRALNRRVEIVKAAGSSSGESSAASTTAPQSPDAAIKVPSVTGIPLTQARAILSALRLSVVVKAEPAPAALSSLREMVKAQSPAAGTSVHGGSAVLLTTTRIWPATAPAAADQPLSTGPKPQQPQVSQPPAEASQSQAAAQALAKIDAAREQAAQALAKAAEDKAKAEADARAAEEAALVPVPNVVGQWLAAGKKILASQGYKIQQTGKSAGIIRGQSPAANTKVKKGSTVTITVGK